MMKHYFLSIFFLFLYQIVLSQSIEFSSQYSDFKNCKNYDLENKDTDGYTICDAIDDYEFYIYYDVYSSNYILRTKDNSYRKNISINCGDSREYGSLAEWRMANKKAFALIIRYKCFEMDYKDGSGYIANKIDEYVIVQGLKGYDFYKVINIKEGNANKKARDYADKMYKKVSN